MKRLVILGGGESGAGAAKLGKKLGYEVFLSDKGKLADKYKRVLEELGVEYEEGQHSEERIFSADLVVKSPGIPDKLPMIVGLREKGIEVISEIEFAGRYTDAKMYCITGSNGKTTTTLLLYHILEKAGYDVGLAGNVDFPVFVIQKVTHSYVWRHRWLMIYTGFTWWNCRVSSWTECSSFVVTRPY